ncbi:MAG: ABC transporter permease [Micromonosporaceae bacterium]
MTAPRTSVATGGRPYDPARVRHRLGVWLSVPTVALLGALFLLPLGIFVVYAFFQGDYYEVSRELTIGNFTQALGDSLVRELTLRALTTGLLTAAICVLAGVPLAYVIRFRSGRLEYLLLLLVVLEMFASYLVRIYAWRAILNENGALAPVLDLVGIAPGSLLYTQTAVVLALVHIYLPYVTLVTYAALRNLPVSIFEIASDLGAGTFNRWRKVVLPLVAPAMTTGALYTFVLAASDYVTPQFLGGTRGNMVGLMIQQQFSQLGNYPLGAAMSLIMLLIFFASYAALTGLLRITGLHNVEIRQ